MLEPSGMVETCEYNDLTGKMTTCLTYDNSEILKDNIAAQKSAPDIGHNRYKGNMCKVGTIHLGDVERLRMLGFNLLSPDPDERRRALVYIQENESHMLTVPGKPFAKKRLKWA